MGICAVPAQIIVSFGDVAITTRSLPSVFVIAASLVLFAVACIRARRWNWRDIATAVVLGAIHAMCVSVSQLEGEAFGLPGWVLVGPYVLALIGYGVYRLAGGRPFEDWPWYRFGWLSTMAILVADIGVVAGVPASEGKIWQIGGGCFADALVIGPPFLALIAYWLLDCRSPMVVCSNQCVRIGRCRFGLDGKVVEGEEGRNSES